MTAQVLLVEDKAPLRRSLKFFLEKAGYACDSAATAREALSIAHGSHYDFVIAEYHLPDGNGTTLFDTLKWMLPDAALILISVYDAPAIAHDVARVGVQSVLHKPFDVAQLETALDSARSKLNDSPWKAQRSVNGMPGTIL